MATMSAQKILLKIKHWQIDLFRALHSDDCKVGLFTLTFAHKMRPKRLATKRRAMSRSNPLPAII